MSGEDSATPGTPPPAGTPLTTAGSGNLVTGDDPHDGVIAEPGRWVANLLWCLVVLTLCLSELTLVGTLALLAFTPDAPKASVDAATIVAVQAGILGAVISFFAGRQSSRR